MTDPASIVGKKETTQNSLYILDYNVKFHIDGNFYSLKIKKMILFTSLKKITLNIFINFKPEKLLKPSKSKDQEPPKRGRLRNTDV